MKKVILQLILGLVLLFSTEVKAQQDDYYAKAISILKEQLKNPDATPEQKQAIRDALAETEKILNELKGQEQGVIYSGETSPDELEEIKKRNLEKAKKTNSNYSTPSSGGGGSGGYQGNAY